MKFVLYIYFMYLSVKQRARQVAATRHSTELELTME